MYEIREYEEKDKEELIELWIKVTVEEYGYKEFEDKMKVLNESEYEKILVSVCGGKIIGSMAYKKVDDEMAELRRVYINKNFRGKGIARQLYDKILEIIREKGYKKLMVETRENFQSGINFYYKNNFKLILKEDGRYVFMLDID